METSEQKGIAQKRTIYFEAGKSGTWKPVHVPRGMTDKQLLRCCPAAILLCGRAHMHKDFPFS